MSCISHKKTAKFSQKRVGQSPGCILRLYGDSPTTLPHDARYTDIVCAAISRIEWLPVCSQHIPYVVRHTSSFIRTDTTFWNLATRKQLVPGPLTAPRFLQQRRLAHDEKRRRRRKSCDQCPFLVHTKPNALFGVLTVVLHSRPFCMVCRSILLAALAVTPFSFHFSQLPCHVFSMWERVGYFFRVAGVEGRDGSASQPWATVSRLGTGERVRKRTTA